MKSKPNCFTPMAELQVDWPRILKRIKPRYRGPLLAVNKRHLEQLSVNYKFPVLLIPHEHFCIFNKDIAMLSDITSSINNQLVHKFSGVQFYSPESSEVRQLLDKIIETFDAEVIDVGVKD